MCGRMMTTESSNVRYVLLISFLALLLLFANIRISGAQSVAIPVVDDIITNVITNSTVANYMTSNAYFASWLSDNPKALGYFLNTSAGVNFTLTDPELINITSNNIALVNFLSNPSFGPIVQNPYLFYNLINDTPGSVLGNATMLGCMLDNPSLATLMYYPNGLQAIFYYASGPSEATLVQITSNSGLYCAF